jgi:hypothetical protein
LQIPQVPFFTAQCWQYLQFLHALHGFAPTHFAARAMLLFELAGEVIKQTATIDTAARNRSISDLLLLASCFAIQLSRFYSRNS